MANTNLRQANKAKNDEFYTQLSDIEKELMHYKAQLRGKVIFCNCDDPFESNFFKYFAMNFNMLGLKKLIATCYSPSPIAGTQLSLFDDIEAQAETENNSSLGKKGMEKFTNRAYKIELTEVLDTDSSGSITLEDVENMLAHEKEKIMNALPSKILTYLEGDGDFRSAESIALLKQADIVITNPPFSLFREYVAQLVEYGKRFLIIGNPNSITYKEIFKLIKGNELWLGYKSMGQDMYFHVSKEFAQTLVATKKEGSGYVIQNGEVKGRAMAVWYTNLDTTKRHEKLIPYRKYTPEDYSHYDNYDAINIDKVAEIPEDWDGEMGVPITFLDKFNPDQFEIVSGWNGGKDVPNPGASMTKYINKQGNIKLWNGPTVNKKAKYFRIVIKDRGE